ncbi:MAG: AbrB/MazE/SpoVT family DNA-binding domain-containing protein [bacterium]|nr:AbrB/MazE/SpoVT family DNA-binding domain-containing protein [bacterium]
MDHVTVSPKFQVVIPKSVREAMHLKVGQKLQVIPYGNRLELIPEKPIGSMRGFLKGMDRTLDREEDRL